MRLCDEYNERMGLKPLVLRHASKFFLFFDGGKSFLSVKWIESNSSGYYEFRECVLEKTIKILNKSSVDWSDFETYFHNWLAAHKGFVFSENEVFLLIWLFFIKRNDRFFSQNYSPIRLMNSMKSSKIAREILGEIPNDCQAYIFWNDRVLSVLNNYAYWLKNWD